MGLVVQRGGGWDKRVMVKSLEQHLCLVFSLHVKI